MHTAVLLIAHGSRRDEANEDAHFVAERIRAEGKYASVQPSFLELAEPDIPGGAARCVEAGAEEVLMLPYFLSPGRHVREHLNEARNRLAAQHPQVKWVLCEPLGRHPLLIEIVRERLEETTRAEDYRTTQESETASPSKSRVGVALACIHISAVLYLIAGALLAALSLHRLKLEGEDLALVGIIVLYSFWIVVLGVFAAGVEVVAYGVHKRKYWGWVAGLVVFALYLPSGFLPLGALGLWGLLAEGSRREFGIDGGVAKPDLHRSASVGHLRNARPSVPQVEVAERIEDCPWCEARVAPDQNGRCPKCNRPIA